MNIEEVINILKKYISFSEKECNFPSIWDWNWHMELANDIETLLTAYEKEKEKNKNAYRKANNYLYFNDSADYEVALWEVIRTLRPDLAEKWNNGEDAVLEYIEEE